LVQFVIVRLVTSQWLEGATFVSVLLKLTNQETLVLTATVKVVFMVVSVLSARDVALVRVLLYPCPLTAVPVVAQSVPV